MLKTMLTDSDRRQALIQELIQSSSQLKEEVQQHQARAARQSQRATELEGILESVKGKVQDLEDRYISKAAQHHSQFQQLQQDHLEAEKRCQALELKLLQEQDVVSQLQRKIYFTVKEEEQRSARQNQAFVQIHKRSARHDSPIDQQILDVIDFYESQMQQLRSQLMCQKGEAEENGSLGAPQGRKCWDKSCIEPPLNYKTLLKSYQEQLKETKAQKEELRGEIERLKTDLESRPTVKELKSYKHQLRRMDRILHQSNLKSTHAKPVDVKKGNTAELENLNHMQASICRAHLRNACLELDVQDVDQLVPALNSQALRADAALHFEKILIDVNTLLNSPRVPLHPLRQRRPQQPANLPVQEEQFSAVLPTLEVWAEQLGFLKDLHRALNKLVQRLLPWQPVGDNNSSGDGMRVEDLMLMVDTLLEETSPGDKVLRSPTKNSLQSMVSHFQNLFDVPSLTGIYPRMNEVYTRLGEMTNAMRNLRDVLELDARAPPSEVVNCVARVVSPTETFTARLLHELLESGDIDSIISRLREHKEFFPAFHSLVLELMRNLDVQRIDEILPAVRALQSRVQ
uniref:Centrosomal protein of 70 kDa n=2 Tax=Denticeps clupeoides TaxID=299321 RepID=A0AAY4AV53_9TELE